MESVIANSNGDVKGRQKIIIDTDPGIGMWHFVSILIPPFPCFIALRYIFFSINVGVFVGF